MKKILFLLMLLSVHAYGQANDNIGFTKLNDSRIQTNQTGMKVLGTWGAVSLVSGVAGYLTANTTEWKAFHGMNAVWGATNFLIAWGGYSGAKKEAGTEMSCDKALSRYESNKRLFLINAGLDIAYTGTGLLLLTNANNMHNSAQWRGFGKSIALQGIALLLFDGTMYSLHQHHNKQWYKILQGLCLSGNTVGFNYTL